MQIAINVILMRLHIASAISIENSFQEEIIC